MEPRVILILRIFHFVVGKVAGVSKRNVAFSFINQNKNKTKVFAFSTMAEEEHGSNCQCLSKFDILEAVCAKDDHGKSMLERFKYHEKPHEAMANEVSFI